MAIIRGVIHDAKPPRGSRAGEKMTRLNNLLTSDARGKSGDWELGVGVERLGGWGGTRDSGLGVRSRSIAGGYRLASVLLQHENVLLCADLLQDIGPDRDADLAQVSLSEQ